MAESTKAANFFVSTVKPTVNEFLNDERNIRRGRLASIVLYHMADYWNLECCASTDRAVINSSLDKLRVELISRCPDFSVIRDVADASKHAKLFDSKKLPRELSSSEQITRPPGGFETPFGTAVFNEASIVMITLDNGTVRPLLGAVQSVLSMWENMLSAG